jgi:two-component system LytT family sensor kinase
MERKLEGRRVRPALVWFGVFAGVGLVQGLLIAFMRRASHAPNNSPDVLFQLSGALGAWALLPLVQLVVSRAPPPSRPGGEGAPSSSRSGWAAFVGTHVVGYLCFALLHVAAIRALRRLFLALSLVSVTDGSLEVRLLWEMQNDMVVYAGVASLLTVFKAWRERDDIALRTSALEARLAEAKLDALSARVDPHFFYNALNTISATMYEDLPRTERYLSHLAELMRASLRAGDTVWTLGEERAHTERYLDLMIARFGERLHAEWRQGGAPADARVPRFSIQTLVENAVKHNDSRRQSLSVTIETRLSKEGVEVTVSDDGMGFTSDASGHGRGLARLDETLRLLHGPSARLEWGSTDVGGARVRFIVPHPAP